MGQLRSRSYNLTRNVVVSIISQVIILITSFANRTVFIKLLGAEYLGVDGLFTSILTVFSLAELGIGNAIIYNLYKPIANDDTDKARQYLTLYSKAYNIIMAVIFAVGVLIIPFLKNIVNLDALKAEINIYLVYILFLVNTLSTYFLASRQAVLVVNQQQSVVSVIQTAVKVTVLVVEAIVLFVFKQYYLYLIIRVAGNYVQSVIISVIAKKRYPQLCKKSEEKLTREEKTVVAQNVGALFIKRVGGVVLSSTDNIIINGFISTVMVGIYSNYTMIVTAVRTITVNMFSAMTATIGNFVASKDIEEVEKLFRIYTFGVYLIYGACSICLYVLTNRFITVLWGTDYLLPIYVLLVIVLDYFLYGFQLAINIFRDTTGNFVQGKYRSLVSAGANVIFSLVLVKSLGIFGVILATVISRVCISAWYDPYILYKKFFNQSVARYYIRVLVYLAIVFGLAIVADLTAGMLCGGILGLLLCIPICGVCVILLVLPFVGTYEFKYIYQYASKTLAKVIKK
ncbi:MAG: oligosaccharide flippase family protein [Clostridia bacterium]|nr:oligosaccharide flippase family protein [Clostridia bacterium]